MKKLLTEKEAAELLAVSLQTLRRMRIDGKIPHIKIGRLVRYRPEDIERLVN